MYFSLKRKIKENIKKYQEDIKRTEQLKVEITNCEKIKEKIIQSGHDEASRIIDGIKNKTIVYDEQIKIQEAKLNGLYGEIEKIESILKRANEEVNKKTAKLNKVNNLYKSIVYYFENYQKLSDLQDIQQVIDELNIQHMFTPTTEIRLHSIEFKDLKANIRQIDFNIAEVLVKYEKRYTTKANLSIYRLMVIALNAEIQNILYVMKYNKLDDCINNIKTITQKYLKIAADGNQTITPTLVKFIGEIEYFYIEKAKVEYEYYVRKERTKEEQKALRAQMRQEAEERKVLEAQKKQVEKEEQKYKNEIDKITVQILTADDSDEIRLLNEKILELQKKLNLVESQKEEIINLQNGKAGYIYIISNLGSFGEDIFKVGMTRRLEPQERVDELGDASVPFKFDVHSFIFSDDAVDLEQQIHKKLHNNRYNKINLRKEFFKINIDELEKLVYEIQPSAGFNNTMLAEQYKQSLSFETALKYTDDIDTDDDQDDE